MRVLRSIEGEAVRTAWAFSTICSIFFSSSWLEDTVSTMVLRCFSLVRVWIDACTRRYETHVDPIDLNLRLYHALWISVLGEDWAVCCVSLIPVAALSWSQKMRLTVCDGPRPITFGIPFKNLDFAATRCQFFHLFQNPVIPALLPLGRFANQSHIYPASFWKAR